MRKLFYSLTIILFLSGCGYYSVSGSLPSYLKTAAVPLFENETTEVGLVEDLSDAIEKAILANGSMKIAGEFQADAVVSGKVIDVIDEADVYSRSESAKQFKLRIIADVVFFDKVKNKPIWEGKRVEGWARYDASGGETREDAKASALEMLAKEIIDKTVTGW